MGEVVFICRFQFFLLFVLGGVIAFGFNNCGALAPRPKGKTGVSSSKTKVTYSWPNSTTTLGDSDTIASEVLFSDVDKNSIKNAVFFSKPGDSEPVDSDSDSSVFFVLRLVRSESFHEVKNISNLIHQPDPDTWMLLIDVDLIEGREELMYLSDDGQKIVILDIVGNEAGREHILQPKVKPIKSSSGFSVRHSGANNLVEIGQNLIFIRGNRSFNVESTSDPIHGGWSEFSDWMFWTTSGLECSKICGDGYRICSRICNDPIPLNGGYQCSATKVRVVENSIKDRCEEIKDSSGSNVDADTALAVYKTTCRVRDCEENDCDDYEIYSEDTKNCDPDPENPRPGDPPEGIRPRKPGDPGDGGDGGNGGNGDDRCSLGNNQDCPSGKICDNNKRQCFTPYSINDIYLESTQRVSGGREEPDYSILHKYRITLSHSKSFFRAPKNNIERKRYQHDIADYYCEYKGYGGAINFDVDTYISGQGESDKAYVFCSAANGMNPLSHSYTQCPVHRGLIAFGFWGITHSEGETVYYLKNVRCRRETDDQIIR